MPRATPKFTEPPECERIKRLIGFSGRSLRSVAAEAQVDQANLSKMLAGKRGFPLALAGKLLAAVDAKWADLDP